MKVLLAGHTGLPFGGIATYIESLLNSSLKDHVELNFVETSKGGERTSSRGGWGFRDARSALQNIYVFIMCYLHIRPDVVHITTAQMPSILKHGIMLLIAKILGAKVILHIHCSVSAMFPLNGGALNRFSTFVFKQANGILVLSQEWINITGQFGKTPMRYLPNGINLSSFQVISRPSRKPKFDLFRIIYLGHLGLLKGTFDLIEAVHLIKNENIIVVLVGEPFDKHEYNSIVEKINTYGLDEKIKIYPPEFGEKKLTRLANSDAFILPSHSEGMPISIIESMAAGLPVIASNVGAIPEMVIHNKTGLIVPVGDPQSLAEAIKHLAQSNETCISMGSLAREVAKKKYDIEITVPDLVSFYNYVIDQH